MVLTIFESILSFAPRYISKEEEESGGTGVNSAEGRGTSCIHHLHCRPLRGMLTLSVACGRVRLEDAATGEVKWDVQAHYRGAIGAISPDNKFPPNPYTWNPNPYTPKP